MTRIEELTRLAIESMKRDLMLAKMEAEVIALRDYVKQLEQENQRLREQIDAYSR